MRQMNQNYMAISEYQVKTAAPKQVAPEIQYMEVTTGEEGSEVTTYVPVGVNNLLPITKEDINDPQALALLFMERGYSVLNSQMAYSN